MGSINHCGSFFWQLLLFAALFFVNRVSGDGCHSPKTNTGDEEGLSLDICSIRDALDLSPPDYETAEIIYRQGDESQKITLMDIATGKELSGAFARQSNRLFGEKNWMDAIIQEALAGDGDFDDDTKRVQVIKKVLQGTVLGHRMITNLHLAKIAAKKGKTTKAVNHVERAMANFFGLDVTCAIYGHGQSRGIEFEVIDRGVSELNYDIVESFADAIASINVKPFDQISFTKAARTIERHFLGIYLQAVVKYANRMIADGEDLKAQSEGFGYYHAIAGQVYAKDKDAHETIYRAFNVDSKKGNPKKALKSAVDMVEKFKIVPGAFGVYNEKAAANFEAVPDSELPCEGYNPFGETPAFLDDRDR